MIYTTPLATKQKSPSGTTRLGQREQPGLLYQAPNHMTKPQPLSPAAQAVLDAYGNEIGGIDAIMGSERRGLAAALRALADQGENLYDPHDGKVGVVRIDDILAIAAELEGLDG